MAGDRLLRSADPQACRNAPALFAEQRAADVRVARLMGGQEPGPLAERNGKCSEAKFQGEFAKEGNER